MFCNCKEPKPRINLPVGIITCAICTKLILQVTSQEPKIQLGEIPEIHSETPNYQNTSDVNLLTASGTAPTMYSGASGLRFSLPSINNQINLEEIS